MGGMTKVKETLSAHPDFSVHTCVDSQHDTVSKLLVSHKIGVYLRVSIGCVSLNIFATAITDEHLHSAIAHLKRKTIQISVHSTESRAPSVLPLLTAARHFLETVIVAASADGKEEDAEDLMWMHEHLRVELLNEGSTLKKTWDEGRLQAVVEMYPIINEAVVDLGLAVIANDDGSRTAVSVTTQATGVGG